MIFHSERNDIDLRLEVTRNADTLHIKMLDGLNVVAELRTRGQESNEIIQVIRRYE